MSSAMTAAQRTEKRTGQSAERSSHKRRSGIRIMGQLIGLVRPLLPVMLLAIILGTEGEGLSPETIAACDYTVRIPMSHGVDSLNVAAASAVAFWQLGRGNRK